MLINTSNCDPNFSSNSTYSVIQNDPFVLSETTPFNHHFLYLPNPNTNTPNHSNPSPKSPTQPLSNKRDRHSKIVTSSRPRHRRMRLSIDVARQFFDLQERLGFDRASKTVEWLLVHARSHINKLNNKYNSDSECQEISGLDQASELLVSDNINHKPKRKYNRRSSAIKPPRRSAFDAAAREARDIARKRARKRTIEKKNNNIMINTNIDHDSNQNLISSADCELVFADQEIDDNNKDQYLTMISDKLDDDDYYNNSLIYGNIINNTPQIIHSSTTLFEQRQLDQYQYLNKAWNQVSLMSSINHNNMW